MRVALEKARLGERIALVLAAGWIAASVLAISPYTVDPAAPAKWLATSVLAAALAVLSVFQRDSPRAPVWVFIAFTPLATAYLVAAVASPLSAQSLLALAPWLNIFLFCLLLPGACRTAAARDTLLKVAVLAITSSSLYGFAQHVGYDPFMWADTSRYEYSGLPATFGHPNFAGHVLVLGIVLCIGLLFQALVTKRRVTWVILYAVCLALQTWHLHLTGMRAGWLALAAALALLCLVFFLRALLSRRPHALPGVLLGILLAGVAAGLFALRVLLHRWQDHVLPIDSSWILRLNGYLGSVEHFTDHPWLGAGPGRFRDAIVPYWTEFERRWFVLYDMRNNHAHNEILEAAVEAGLPGVAALLLLFLVALWAALTLLQARDRERRWFGGVAFAAISAVIVDAQFGFNLHTPAAVALAFLLVALTLLDVAPRVARRRNRFISILIALTTIGLAGLAALNFHADWKTLRAQGGIAWAAEQTPVYPDRAKRALRFVADDLRPVCELPFSSAAQWDLLAQAHEELGEHDAAADAYAEALARAPYDPKLMARTAHFLLDSFKDSDAIDEARQLAEAAVTLCPDLSEANLAQARAAWAAYEQQSALRPEPRFSDEAARQRWRRENWGRFWDTAREHASQAARFSAKPDTAAWELLDQLNLAESGVGDANAREAALRVEPWNGERWTALQELLPQESMQRIARELWDTAAEQWPVPVHLPELAIQLHRYRAPEAGAMAVTALQTFPDRLALWGICYDELSPQESLPTILSLRDQLGVCDAETERRLAPLYALMDALDKQEVPALAAAIEGISALGGLLYDSGREDIEQEIGWLGQLAESTVRSRRLAPEESAGLYLRIANVYDRAALHADAARLAWESVHHLREVERAGALLLLSQYAARRADNGTALTLARQAAALAPYALPVRWNLAERLADTSNNAEADFEFASLVSQLSPATREGRERLERYEQFRRSLPAKATP